MFMFIKEEDLCMPCTQIGKWCGVGSGVCVVMAVGLLMQSVAMANPHEPREVGPYTLAVGFRIEPAFEDVVNALDFFVTRTSDGKPISVSNGDVVDIEAQVQFRKEESVASAIIQEHRLAKPEQAFGADNRYNAWFKPTIDGAYGFRVRGEINDLSDPHAGPLFFDEVWVCGAGTQNPQGRRFACVADPQTFPKGILDHRGIDHHGYQDDDRNKFFRDGESRRHGFRDPD